MFLLVTIVWAPLQSIFQMWQSLAIRNPHILRLPTPSTILAILHITENNIFSTIDQSCGRHYRAHWKFLAKGLWTEKVCTTSKIEHSIADPRAPKASCSLITLSSWLINLKRWFFYTPRSYDHNEKRTLFIHDEHMAWKKKPLFCKPRWLQDCFLLWHSLTYPDRHIKISIKKRLCFLMLGLQVLTFHLPTMWHKQAISASHLVICFLCVNQQPCPNFKKITFSRQHSICPILCL